MFSRLDCLDDRVELGLGQVTWLPFDFGSLSTTTGCGGDFYFVPELFFEVMDDGDAAVGVAFFANDAIGPDAQGEVGPVVFAGLKVFPGLIEFVTPLGQAEEFPQGCGGDLHAFVEVWFPGGRDLKQIGFELLQF